MPIENQDRLATEVDLIRAMYSDNISYQESAGELTYSSEWGTLRLRLSTNYPSSDQPEIVLANDSHKRELRGPLTTCVSSRSASEESLDVYIAAFIELASQVQATMSEQETLDKVTNTKNASNDAEELQKTVVIWLHHLLNTSKRKQALASEYPSISGISKPGYPGVLIFSGPAISVDEHVNALKHLNWAAFQVRFEADSKWTFAHGKGVLEVESMGHAVKEVGPHKDDFLAAMKIK